MPEGIPAVAALQARPICHIIYCIFMKENAFNYDKGVLAEILEPIMGKGLIPADLETWKPRRRAIVPAFHKAYLEAMVRMFCTCTQWSLDKFQRETVGGKVSILMTMHFLGFHTLLKSTSMTQMLCVLLDDFFAILG